MDIDENKKEYMFRVNKVLDYIEQNLNQSLTLEELSLIANFSKYHFHRIFKSIVKENIATFTKRLRLERSASMLRNFIDYSITRIASEVGFSSASSYTAAFKERYGLTPSDYRHTKEKITSVDDIGQSFNQEFSRKSTICMELIRDYKLVYARHIGDYHEAFSAWDKVIEFGEKEGIINSSTKYIGISYDDPILTKSTQLRYDACITINIKINISGDIGMHFIKGGLYAVYKFYDQPDQIIGAYEYIYSEWLPESGYVPDDKNSFEIYVDGIELDESRKVRIDICIPVRRLHV